MPTAKGFSITDLQIKKLAELKEKMIQLEIKIADSDFKFGLLLDEVRASNDLLKKLTKDFQANL